MDWTVERLQAFEQGIAEIYNSGQIRAPVHLSGGNEQQLIEYFAEHRIGPKDWVCTTWRSHYHALLKGVPPEKLKADIVAGKSITLTYPEQRVISSAIVGGIIPIGLGIAKSIKMNWVENSVIPCGYGCNWPACDQECSGRPGQTSPRVFVFVGDMTSLTGIFNECVNYGDRQGLHIFFVIENNGLSVCTNTEEVWGTSHDLQYINNVCVSTVDEYEYKLTWPHAGAGKRIQF